jgi:hypothetical protein
MEHCYCPQCKSVQGFHTHEKQSVKIAAGLAGATTKLTGFVADQVQYETDKSNGKPITAELRLMQNKQQTNQMANMSSGLVETMAGGRFELRCNTCSTPIEYPQAQSFDDYRALAQAGFAHKNRWYMTAVGCMLGAGIALLTKTFGANGVYVSLFVGGGVIGHFSPRFLSPKVNSILNIVFSSAKLFYAFCFFGMLTAGISAMFGKTVMTITVLAYTGLGLFGIYSVLKDQIEKRKEIFSDDVLPEIPKIDQDAA